MEVNLVFSSRLPMADSEFWIEVIIYRVTYFLGEMGGACNMNWGKEECM
jgi:hypothetical protein